MKTFKQIREASCGTMPKGKKAEGYVSMAQQRAVWATRKDGGKGHPDNKKKSKKEEVDEAKRVVHSDRPDSLASIKVMKPKDPKKFNQDKKYPPHLRGDSIGKAKKAFAHTKNEDSDAVKAFLAKGGKIKKLPAAKAQGYHGKDDPGKGVHGMMDKPDSKAMRTRKKVGSMK
jgi:predicted Rdx family selenoprotein